MKRLVQPQIYVREPYIRVSYTTYVHAFYMRFQVHGVRNWRKIYMIRKPWVSSWSTWFRYAAFVHENYTRFHVYDLTYTKIIHDLWTVCYTNIYEVHVHETYTRKLYTVSYIRFEVHEMETTRKKYTILKPCVTTRNCVLKYTEKVRKIYTIRLSVWVCIPSSREHLANLYTFPRIGPRVRP